MTEDWPDWPTATLLVSECENCGGRESWHHLAQVGTRSAPNRGPNQPYSEESLLNICRDCYRAVIGALAKRRPDPEREPDCPLA